MGRGILFGAFWGFLVGACVLAIASLMGEAPIRTGAEGPEAGSFEVPAGTEFDQAGEDVPVTSPALEPPVDVATDAPLVTAPVTPPTPALNDTVTQSASRPETGGSPELAQPPAGAPSSGVSLSAEAGSDGATPAQALPEPAEEDPVRADPAPALPQVAPTPVAPTAEPAPAAPVLPADNEADASAAQDADDSSAPQTAVLDTSNPAVRPTVSTGGFGNRASDVTVNRPTEGTVIETAEPAPEEEAAPADPRPLVQYASAAGWDGPDDRPLFSLVLIDEAADASRFAALASFTGPITFAVPASAPGARDAMEAYRAAGHEVALLADLPEGLRPSDVEVAMAGYFQAVPEAVAVLDGTFSGFRGDRAVSEQVVEILAESGHGLLTFEAGLNTAARLAEQEGVPVRTVFRDLDGEGQGNTIIRRFLDQAAFSASQEGEVVLVARMRAETISALLIWQQQDRAARVNLAPLSALLLGDE
ncbi:MAG: divergent polysaccharide deacetylase family protein [Pseudomonadota bacterium]